uniref:Bridge-like lipid transfer protein family member 1 C-terminal domain-containing protein n=1 Tax=Sinocyclocheilus grahami TaxID=75366 RepID=A0A672MMI1_SINGR
LTGAQTRFTFELPNHKLCFQSKVSPVDVSAMPPTASLTLPPVTMSGQYIIQEHEGHSDTAWAPEYSNYLQGNYLRCVAEIGSFEHNLTTDLLNHLVFLQKVFMKEVNEVIQKVSGGEQPIPLWNEHDMSTDGDKPKILLYSINLTFKGIQMTATTPSMRAVRFETGWIELELSNRVQCKTTPTGSNYLKLFGKCQVDLNLALGQIVKHQVYEEAGSDFHQVAYFRTRIGLRNALQEEISSSSGKEAVLITLNRPIVFAQPVAFDRAVLFWLNYKAAYDNWKEQRLALNSDIHMATKEVVDKLPAIQQTSLTVNDLGICLPITSTTQCAQAFNCIQSCGIDFDTGSALVLTIESTLITACSSESLVSKGHFKNFCIRFAEGFETTWDDWKPEIRGDLVINACDSSAGTWTLNVLWKMCGIDVHMDPNIGKRLNALGNTLTSLTGEEDNDDITDLNSVNMADLSDEDESDGMSPPIHMESVDLRRQAVMSNQIIDARGRKFSKRLVDIRELNEQAKVIDDLKKLGASEGTINQEIQRYQHLESVAVNDIRRDVRKKLRRSSMRAASLKDKWGLGYKPSYNNSRSKSISATGRPPMKRSDRPRDDLPDIKVDAASPAPRVTFNIDTPDDTRRDDLSSTSSEDSDKDDEFDRDRPHSCYRRPGGSQRKSSALSALFSERWPATPPQRGGLAPPTERNIDFELDVRVEIDSGKCVLHPSTQPPEHEDLAVRRSCEQSSRSLDQESPPKKRKQQHSFASSSHLLNAKRVPTSLQSKSSDIETTVFYIPGVDVKLHYNSKMLKTESPNASRGSSLPRTLSKESKLYGMRDVPTPPASGPGKTNTLLHPPPPPLPSGTHSIPFWSSTAGFLHALSLFSVTGAWPTDLSSTVWWLVGFKIEEASSGLQSTRQLYWSGIPMPHGCILSRNLLLSVHDNLATEKDCFQLCLEEPNIAFWTEAQKIWEDGTSDDSTYIVQTLDFHLGHNTMVTKPCGALESPMATITKVTRRRHENPPHGVATVKEWFNYVTAMRNEELNLLRNVDANNSESGAATKSSSLLSGFRGASSYNHETETIFALPKMQLQFKSIHVQDPEEPSLSDSSSKPKVECSVVTEFTDHICVTMDAELIMFLHDLVSAYLKEKEKALFAPRILASRAGQKSPTAQQDEASSEKKEEGVNYTTVDWREFLCNTWHLEPTLRLISWTGRKIDPVGVDYILQKLGFHHARTTIPKWLQRGVMDPLDKVLSVLIKKLGMTLQDEKEKKGQRDKDEH